MAFTSDSFPAVGLRPDGTARLNYNFCVFSADVDRTGDAVLMEQEDAARQNIAVNPPKVIDRPAPFTSSCRIPHGAPPQRHGEYKTS